MEIQSKPYFMSNPEWFTEVNVLEDGFPEDGRGYHLTDNAPIEAVDSYNEFYGMVGGFLDVTIDQ